MTAEYMCACHGWSNRVVMKRTLSRGLPSAGARADLASGLSRNSIQTTFMIRLEEGRGKARPKSGVAEFRATK